MGFSISILVLYLPVMILVLVVIRGKVQLPAATIMGAYLFSFSVKVTSDTLRVVSSEDHMTAM